MAMASASASASPTAVKAAASASAMAMKPQLLRLLPARKQSAWASSNSRLPGSFLFHHSSCSASVSPSSGLGFRLRSAHGAGPAEEAPCAAATTPFHLAIPVHDIGAARAFFGGVLGCSEGRSATTWVDFNLFGHQVVCHEVRNYNASSSANAVDGDPVPVPHFGLAMSVPEFHAMAERVRAAGVAFIIEPHIRFAGQPGEQWTMFFKDSSGNALEFKAMTTPSNLFAKYVVE